MGSFGLMLSLTVNFPPTNLSIRTVVLKSTCAAGAGFNPAPVVINEQRVVGSRCGPFKAALELLAGPGGINVERYISGK